MKSNNNRRTRLRSVADVKQELSEEEFAEAKRKLERAEQTLEDVKTVLSGALFLHNGKLSTGTIDYAAFRIETLSLIYEVAFRNFCRSAKSGPKAYDEFLADLGDEVGFTFARDLITKLKNKDLFREVDSPKRLIQLWALFENDTGAGETKLKRYSIEEKEIVIQLRNNPLRRIESSPHAHCGFYCSYIGSLLNELFTLRARLIEQQIDQVTAQAFKAVDVLEQPDLDDNCVFVVQVRPEILTNSFDALCDAYDQFYKLSDPEADDFSPCASQARSALVSAQMETIRLDTERPPRQLFKVFQGVLPRDHFKRMDEAYQVASKYVHSGEVPNSKKLTRSRCWEMLRDIRRSVYAFEFLDITEEQRAELRDKATLNDRLAVLTELLRKAEELPPEDRKETVQLLSQLEKGKLVEEEHQARLVERLSQVGGKVWEVAKPVLTDVLTAAIRKQYEL